jgi:putative membrane protein
MPQQERRDSAQDRQRDGQRDGEHDGKHDGEPDYRYTLANERTFLAWVRTALALLAAAVAIVQFAPDLGPQWFREACGVGFALLAAAASAGGLWRWLTTQRAMRRGEHLDQGLLPAAVTVGLATAATGVVVVLVWNLGR